MSEKMIPASEIENMITRYWEYEQTCVDYDLKHSGNEAVKAAAKASLYRAVIRDLENLLPPKTMADIPGNEWESYEGAWAELNGDRCLIVKVFDDSVFPIRVLYTDTGDTVDVLPDKVIPLDGDRAWW